MKHQIFTIYDTKAQCYLQPFFSQNHATAIRSIEELCNDYSHQFCRYAEDYSLFHLGEFEDTNAVYNLDNPTIVVNLIELKKPDQMRQQEFKLPDGPELND